MLPSTLAFLVTISFLFLSSFLIRNPFDLSFSSLPTSLRLHNQSNYSFDNPLLAFHLLKQLDPPPLIDPIYHKDWHNWTESNFPIPDDLYCSKALKHFVENTDDVFDNMQFFVYYRSKLLRELVRQIGTNLHPDYRYKLDKKKINSTRFYIDPKVNIIFLWNSMSPAWELNRHIACTHQLYNQVIDVNSVYHKDRIDQYYKDYVASLKARDSPSSCLPTFMPESFLLHNKTQCEQFFEYINTTEYNKEKKKDGMVFLKKVGALVHAAKGVELVDKKVEAGLRKSYDNGRQCGTVSKQLVIQRYIKNPFLVYGHKFDMRVYLLIASVNPLIVYYHDGNIRVSLHEYNSSSKEKAAHLTNGHLALEAIDVAKEEGTWNGMTEAELLDFQSWNYSRLQKYMVEHAKTDDPEWLEKVIKKQMKQAMVHIVTMTEHLYFKRSNAYQMMGLDFLLDDEMKLWFIEANKKPGFDRYNDEDNKFQVKMLSDMFELMFAYLRSRLKRVVEFVNKVGRELQEEGKTEEGLRMDPERYEETIREFQKINTNYLEEEFGLSKNNGFVKIIDEAEVGRKRYAEGLVSEECGYL